MKTYRLNLQSTHNEPLINRTLAMPASCTFDQLHHSITDLFGWQEQLDYRFIRYHEEIASNERQDQIVPLHSWMINEQNITYIIGNQGHEKRIQIQIYENQFFQGKFSSLLPVARELLEQFDFIAPSLIKVQFKDHMYPCYIDQLDNGLEVIVYQNENGFCRSIVNSINGDPDLLFTEALTIDFLYDKVEESELFLSDGHNLCFYNRPGCLPSHPSEHDFELLYNITKALMDILQTETTLPCIQDKQMGVYQNQTFDIVNYVTKEDLKSVVLTPLEQQQMTHLPHTNEHIKLRLLALPNKDCEKTKKLDIHLVATGQDYTKDVCLSSMDIPTFLQQLQSYLLELFHARGIPEIISTSNMNLGNMIKKICCTYDIALKVGVANATYSNDLLDFILESLQVDDKVYECLQQEDTHYTPLKVMS